MSGQTADVNNIGGFVRSIAETFGGDFKQSEYEKAIRPLVLLRRPDSIPENSKEAFLTSDDTFPDGVDDATCDMILFGAVVRNVNVYDLSRFTFDKLRGQHHRQLHNNLVIYINRTASPKKDKKI